MDRTAFQESAFKTWIVIFFFLVVILFQGALSYLVVGDLGQPGWDFSTIKDVPGESPYAVYQLTNPQHIRGAEEEIRIPGGFEKQYDK